MKILQINSVSGLGSTGRIVTDIYEIYEKLGNQAYIAYGRNKYGNQKNIIKIGNKIDVYYHLLITRIFDRHGFASKIATKNFINEIKKINPDIIHLHNLHGYYINIKILFDFLSEYKKPVIWTLHDTWSFTGHCSHFDYIKCDKWLKSCRNCPQNKEYPKSCLIDNSEKNYTDKKEIFNKLENLTIVTPSNWLKSLVEKSFLSKYEIMTINNGIDLKIFKPTKSNFRQKYHLEDEYIVLGVANVWTEKKGLNHFIKLSQLISDQIVLVGINNKQKRKLPQNIISIPKTNNVKELAEIYSAADVFINPTYEDTFPTTNLESIACGTPVITFNTGGSIESIFSETGLITEDKTTESLVKSINKIKTSNLNYKKTTCMIAKKLFNKEDRYNDYIDLYYQRTEKYDGGN